MKKADVAEILRDMPDEIDPDELMHRLYLKMKIERAEADVRAGNTIPHAEVVRITETWER